MIWGYWVTLTDLVLEISYADIMVNHSEKWNGAKIMVERWWEGDTRGLMYISIGHHPTSVCRFRFGLAQSKLAPN